MSALLFLVVGVLLATGYGNKHAGTETLEHEQRIAASPPRAAQFATGIIKKGAKAPDFNLRRLEGGRLRLSDYSGKVVMLDFWSIGCPPCIEGTALLQKLYMKYKIKGFMVVGINIDSYPNMVKKFVQRARLTYPICLADRDVVKKYGGLATIPQSFLINRKGLIARHYDGFGALSAYLMERDIRQALGLPK